MADNNYINHQIARKDAKNCFVESLDDSFGIGKIHFAFSTYDTSKPTGQRQTNNVQIYINSDEFLELCRKLEFGELKFMMNKKRETNDSSPLYETMGGTSAENLAKRNKSRPDGKSISRIARLSVSNKGFFFTAESGAGETDSKGLIVPRFGNNPENRVSIPLTFEDFSELMLITKMHFGAYLSARYMNAEDKGGVNR